MTVILEALEVKTKLEAETKLAVGIKTPLDTITITLQYRREDDQESQSK